MGRADHSGFVPATCWPVSWQQTLLRAVIGPEEDRVAAWEAFQAECDLERLDSASHALLPLAWTTVVQHRPEDPWRAKIKGTWRQQWVRHETIRRALAGALSSFAERGVDVALVESAASAFVDATDGTLRPWTELTLAVREEAMSAAASVIERDGWRLDVETAGSRRWSREGTTISLRCPIFPEGASDAVLWRRMEAADTEAIVRSADAEVESSMLLSSGRARRIAVLSHPERLIQLAYHGLVWGAATPLLVYVDAAMIVGQLRSDERQAVVEAARAWEMIDAVKALVSFLHVMGVRGAGELLEQMKGVPTTVAGYVELRLRERRPNRFAGHARQWLRARRMRRAAGI